jgi:spore maturation protein A
MSKIWASMICISIVISLITYKPEIVINSLMNDSKTAIENVINLAGMMCFWSGIFKIFENTSLLQKLSNFINKIIRRLFDKKEMNKEIEKYVSLNIASNLLGLGNAATINGIKAIEEMNKLNKTDSPTNNMTKFVLINTASLQIIPTSMIAMRSLYNSNNPTLVLVPILIATFLSLTVGIISINILNKIMK